MTTSSGNTYSHPSQDMSSRFPLDVMLRLKGYKIAVRREEEEPIWERDGKRFLQRELVEQLTFDEIMLIETQEKEYKKRRKKK